ncbi:peptidoglycan DD-metalloendopeptidase family protein [Catenovulum sp. SM1970]|uniref:peptidoglycan DD-metalloendopeptidase family protein n=1 Tax=Marinifaba aquimaris TaxID=2741323 RepID=UPI001573DE41|nr:peptidoglycan DD-metalloendopeptidase family protein [Marinifaba aquimaris]NTS75620.1 peptidoglycan DD-metalloendopeptidase family protein [Marinifaba aquimaris]
MKEFWSRLPHLHKVCIGSISAIVVAVAIWPTDEAQASRNTVNDDSISQLFETGVVPGQRYALPIPETKQEVKEITENDVSYVNKAVKVRKNDSLAKIFSRHKIPAKTLIQVTNAGKLAKDLIRKLRPGDELTLTLTENNQLHGIIYPLSATETLYIERQDDKRFAGHRDVKPVETTEAFAYADIASNFWNAGVDAGLTEAQIMNLANIFGWDIDFALDLRKGDHFNVIFEKQYIAGEYIGPGKILAAEFINQGEKYAAVRHSDGNYYTPAGRSMRKAFLRAPVNFKYISSNFNPRRLHPVTGKVRPHRGIDYAARTGTPVVSSGDGKVIKSGYSRLNGNYIFIEHGNTYVTKYLHLHKRHVKKGQKVRQGQKIGTVGATGRVTGPHLHYEFLVNGVHRNPRTVKLPKSQPIDKKEREDFLAQSSKMTALMKSNKRILLAMQQD